MIENEQPLSLSTNDNLGPISNYTHHPKESDSTGDHLNTLSDKIPDSHSITIIDHKNDNLPLPVNSIADKSLSTDHSKLENVYSNIPPMATTITSPIAVSSTPIINQIHVSSNQLNKSDPSLHVYSNITSPIATPQKTKITNTTFNNTNSKKIERKKSIEHLNMNDDDILSATTASFLADDLDLDDPVIVTSNFGVENNKNTTIVSHVRSSNNNSSNNKSKNNNNLKSNHQIITATPAAAGAATNTTTNATSHNINNDTSNKNVENNDKKTNNSNNTITTTTTNEMKSISLPEVAIIDTQHQQYNSKSTTNNVASATNNAFQTNSQQSFISPSRMRLLQDTTMIDTALDLDSLDGSIINVVAKTANV